MNRKERKQVLDALERKKAKLNFFKLSTDTSKYNREHSSLFLFLSFQMVLIKLKFVIQECTDNFYFVLSRKHQ